MERRLEIRDWRLEIVRHPISSLQSPVSRSPTTYEKVHD